MDWITGLQKAVDYIEEHLTEDICYDDIAAESFSSSYHFQRVFSILCGFTIGEYIRRRRLSLAGAELAGGEIKVIDAALKYGYENDLFLSMKDVSRHRAADSVKHRSQERDRPSAQDSFKKLPSGPRAYSAAVCKCYGCDKGGSKKSAPWRGENRKGRSGPRPILLCGRVAVAKMEKEKKEMSKKNNRINVPEAREAMDKFKMEAASEVGVNLKEGYNGDISAREAGSVGGQMVKKMTTIRTARFERADRTAVRHVHTVEYRAELTV